MQVIYMQT